MSYIQSKDIVQLTIEASGFCNAKCPHCPRYTDDGFLHNYVPETHLRPDVVNGLDKSLLSNLKVVNITGATGDPLMNPDIERLLEFFDFVPCINMDTNGSIRNPQWWNSLARFKNLTMVWAIDGLKDTNHLYRIDVNYDQVIKNASAFISAGGKSIWKCIIFKHNQHQIDEVIDTATQLGFAGVKFVRAYDYRFQSNKVWPVYVEGKYMHDISPGDLTQQYLDSRSTIGTVSAANYRSNVNCLWLKNSTAYINVLGELLPCCMMTHETTNDYPGKEKFLKMIGSADNISLYKNKMDDILEIYYGEKFNQSLTDENTMHEVCLKSCANSIKHNLQRISGLRVPIKKIQ